MATYEEKALHELYAINKETVRDVVLDKNGVIISFKYKKIYSNYQQKFLSAKLAKPEKPKRIVKPPPSKIMELEEKKFFALLAEVYKDVTKIKLHCEKIIKFEYNGVIYTTEKSETRKLFDFFDYADFLTVCRSRFYGIDARLRNGYFSGLIGTNYPAIKEWKGNKEKYTLYDIDFNGAYPNCLQELLPYGRFYTSDEWKKEDIENNIPHIKFYDIKINGIENDLKMFIPPAPYEVYKDFDFLMQKKKRHLLISETRLELIRRVYGMGNINIIRTFYCKSRRYVKLYVFARQLYEDIRKAKEAQNGALEVELKIALNSLIGQFARRDEAREISGLDLNDRGVFSIRWTQAERKEQHNYLPISMVINDLTALKLFELLTNENCLRICHNTDGGIVAVKKNTKIVSDTAFGKIKAKQLFDVEFYYSTLLYNRPLIYDTVQKKVFNAKSIKFDGNNFIFTETFRLNTVDGFKIKTVDTPTVAEPYKYFNFRKEEILLLLWAKDSRFMQLRKRIEKAINNKNDDFIEDDRNTYKAMLEIANNPQYLKIPPPVYVQQNLFDIFKKELKK